MDLGEQDKVLTKIALHSENGFLAVEVSSTAAQLRIPMLKLAAPIVTVLALLSNCAIAEAIAIPPSTLEPEEVAFLNDVAAQFDASPAQVNSETLNNLLQSGQYTCAQAKQGNAVYEQYANYIRSESGETGREVFNAVEKSAFKHLCPSAGFDNQES